MVRNLHDIAAMMVIGLIFAVPAHAADLLKSPDECDLHRAISNVVPAECASTYRSIVKITPGAPPSPAPVAQVSTGPKSVALKINFEYNSARLTSEAKGDLDRLANVLNHGVNTATAFMVSGHTDASGTEAYNSRLSAQRADAVALYLEARGVGHARLKTTGKGKSELLDAANPTSSINRRVEITNLGR